MDDLATWTHVAPDWLNFQAASLPNMVFFQEINDFLTDEIQEYGDHLLGRASEVAGAAALSLLTLWILVQGYRIVTGQSHAPMMALVVDSLRAVLIIGLATSAAAGAGALYGALTDGMTDTVHAVMTGHAGSGMDQDIDKTLAVMQTALTVIDSVDTGGDVITDKAKDKALWFAGVGLGGPAMTAAGTLLLNKIAMALILGLGPLFILCLLFESTKPMFAAWLYYGLGTLCSLALLSVMVTLALDMVMAVGLAFWAGGWLNGDQDSLLSMAMQQGGLGVLLSTLIISAPPMVAMFFRGSMGQFTAFVMFGQSQSRQAPTTGQGHPQTASDQTTSTPTHAFRDISTPLQQADEIKRAPEASKGSFLERYPNALAGLEGHGGSGDPLPASLRPITGDAKKSAVREYAADNIDLVYTERTPTPSGGYLERPRKLVQGSAEYEAARSLLSDDALQRVATAANELGRKLEERNKSDEIETFNSVKSVAIEVNPKLAHRASYSAKAIDGMIMINPDIFLDYDPLKQNNRVAHEFRHLMAVNLQMTSKDYEALGSQGENDAEDYAVELFGPMSK